MLVKIYDHTGAEALHSALSETKSGTEVERGTITAIVILVAGFYCESLIIPSSPTFQSQCNQTL